MLEHKLTELPAGDAKLSLPKPTRQTEDAAILGVAIGETPRK
jgi:hypothetical protein